MDHYFSLMDSMRNDTSLSEVAVDADGAFSPILGFARNTGSCTADKCGVFKRGSLCQCTDQCEDLHNCCDNYASVCKDRPTPPPTPAPPFGVWDCESNLELGPVARPEKKGIALDDTTFEHCADQVPTHWPNTDQKVLSVRLFKAWGMTSPKYFKGDRHQAWAGLKAFAEASGAKFLVGVSLTCWPDQDEKEWAAGQEFMKYVGAEHIMGIAVGNEVDLHVPGREIPGCVQNLWNKDGYIKMLQRRVQEFEAIDGMPKDLPITAVISMVALMQFPFRGAVGKFLKQAWDLYGDRFKFSINVYPQFSDGLPAAGCKGAIDVGTKFTATRPVGFIPAVVQDLRKRLVKAGVPEMKIWLGEHGWATGAHCTLCGEACKSKWVQQQYYTNFLKWDLSASDVPGCGEPSGACAASIRWAKTDGIYAHPEWYPGLKSDSSGKDFQIHMAKQESAEARGGCALPCDVPGANDRNRGLEADHVFYFTLRDSAQFGQAESFGLLDRCGSHKCKFQK